MLARTERKPTSGGHLSSAQHDARIDSFLDTTGTRNTGTIFVMLVMVRSWQWRREPHDCLRTQGRLQDSPDCGRQGALRGDSPMLVQTLSLVDRGTARKTLVNIHSPIRDQSCLASSSDLPLALVAAVPQQDWKAALFSSDSTSTATPASTSAGDWGLGQSPTSSSPVCGPRRSPASASGPCSRSCHAKLVQS